MSKRELEQLTGGRNVEGPRTKRRRETSVTKSSEVDVSRIDSMMPTNDGAAQGCRESRELVQRQGIKLWQTVRDCVNKEGRILSLDFLRRPSKRDYPDYYQVIQRPVALEEIKKKLDAYSYPALEVVRADLERCFLNAKQYNMPESVIWNDANELLKLVLRTYNKLMPAEEDIENVDDDGKGKSKTPNLTRLIKSRLQKLVDKTDETGRVLSTEFMELPSKKLWAIYYKTIKRPQCLENIFKRIKRKEYFDASEFAADVELVFANAMEFNQEHTPIWEDARTLRDFFRHLMADLPPPFAVPKYTKPSNGKIKIKMPPSMQSSALASSAVAPAVSSTPIPSTQTSNSSSGLILRVPASTQEKASQEAKLGSNDTALPSGSVAAAGHVQPTSTATTLPTLPVSSFPNSNNPVSRPADPSPTAPASPLSTSNPTLEATAQSASFLQSPGPPFLSVLRSVALVTKPVGRMLNLDYRDGVKFWALRLASNETEVHVDHIVFFDDEEGDDTTEERDNDAEEEHVDEDLESAHSKGNRKKIQAMARTKSKASKGAANKAKTMSAKKKQKTVVQVKFNGTAVKSAQDRSKWVLQPSPGMNILEVGENGGLLWKVYVQRGIA